jgi:hypothetical protein
METQQQDTAPILKAAWTKFGQLDAAAGKRSNLHENLRRWIAIFGVLSTFLAIVTSIYPDNFPAVGGFLLKLLLIISPITASALAAYASEFFRSGDWLITRAGAEEILKEVYKYRTILQKSSDRRAWLEKRLNQIQRSVYRGMNGELVMDAYKGELPPSSRFNPKDPNSDRGFKDMTGEEYFQHRLQDQLNWHVRKVNQKQAERMRLKILILISGAAGAFLAALGAAFEGGINLWVALTASLTTTFIGWQELRGLDLVVRNYSKVIMELNILSDHWLNLEQEERTQTEFYKMVENTEDVLWSRNVEYIKAMQEALKESSLDEEAELINRVIQEQRDSDRRLRKSIQDAIVNEAAATMEEADEALSAEINEVVGSLAEEAASDVVQAEFAAMKDAVRETLENVAERMGFSHALEALRNEFDGVEISGNTPSSVLNNLMSRYPKTTDAKG